MSDCKPTSAAHLHFIHDVYWLTPRNTILEKLTVPKLAKKISAFHVIAVLKHATRPNPEPDESSYIIANQLILFLHQSLALPSDHFLSSFPTKFWMTMSSQ
jgi:hypothetical protein